MADFKKGIFIGPHLLPIIRIMPAELLKETLMWFINDAEDKAQDEELSKMGQIMVTVFSPSVHEAQKAAERRHNAAVKNGKKKGKNSEKAKAMTPVASKKNPSPVEVEPVADSATETEEQAEETKPALKKSVSREKKKAKAQQTQQPVVIVEDEVQSENEKVEEEQGEKEFKSNDRLFEIFWHTYPNKENKIAAFEEWTKLQSSSEWPGLPTILETLRREIFSRGWDDPNAVESCPLATAWLHFMSWK